MLTMDSIVVAAPQQVSSHLGDEAVILNLKNGVYYGLDAVGARIWVLLQNPRSLADVRTVILEEYDVDPERCEHDLLALLTDLATNELIEVCNATGT